MRALYLFCIMSMAACSSDPGSPAWAIDPIWIEPVDQDAVRGFQTWQVYGPGWDNGYAERHYICAAIVRIDGQPTECESCDVAWEVQTRLVETDCEGLDTERFLTLERLQLRAAGVRADDRAPYAGQSALVDADYGAGWEPYGWAWPTAVEQGRASTSEGVFDGTEPFQLQPTLLWDLTL